jgi:hypothetical protein
MNTGDSAFNSVAGSTTGATGARGFAAVANAKRWRQSGRATAGLAPHTKRFAGRRVAADNPPPKWCEHNSGTASGLIRVAIPRECPERSGRYCAVADPADRESLQWVVPQTWTNRAWGLIT